VRPLVVYPRDSAPPPPRSRSLRLLWSVVCTVRWKSASWTSSGTRPSRKTCTSSDSPPTSMPVRHIFSTRGGAVGVRACMCALSH
jgi:hypothetical protein